MVASLASPAASGRKLNFVDVDGSSAAFSASLISPAVPQYPGIKVSVYAKEVLVFTSSNKDRVFLLFELHLYELRFICFQALFLSDMCYVCFMKSIQSTQSRILQIYKQIHAHHICTSHRQKEQEILLKLGCFKLLSLSESTDNQLLKYPSRTHLLVRKDSLKAKT